MVVTEDLFVEVLTTMRDRIIAYGLATENPHLHMGEDLYINFDGTDIEVWAGDEHHNATFSMPAHLLWCDAQTFEQHLVGEAGQIAQQRRKINELTQQWYAIRRDINHLENELRRKEYPSG